MFGKDSKKKELIKNLDKIYDKIQRTYNISAGDFPDIGKMREHLELTVSWGVFGWQNERKHDSIYYFHLF